MVNGNGGTVLLSGSRYPVSLHLQGINSKWLEGK